MVVGNFTPHIAKFARFSLGRFTNRWANEEELKSVLPFAVSLRPSSSQGRWESGAGKGSTWN